jgi:hypothetical protein
MVSVEGVGSVPENMWQAFKILQNLYKEPLIPMTLGSEEHGASTNMASITVGIDNMLKTILENYHEVPEKYKSGSSYFTVAHEFGHITTHPGKDSDYWANGANEFPIESANRQKWLNVLSDIMVNWSVMTGTNIRERDAGDEIRQQLRDGFVSGQFNAECQDESNILLHKKLLKEGKNAYGIPMVDNRFKPIGMKIGQYNKGESSNLYKPTAETPFYERYVGHGRGPQYYPALSYATKNNLDKRFRYIEVMKSINGLSKGSKHHVKETLSFYGGSNAAYEPVKEYILENGTKVNARYCRTLCPDCKKPTRSIWDNWWGYKEDRYNQMVAEHSGTYIHLMTQLFVYQWAALYATYIPYNGKIKRSNAKAFLKDVSETMDLVMGDE